MVWHEDAAEPLVLGFREIAENKTNKVSDPRKPAL